MQNKCAAVARGTLARKQMLMLARMLKLPKRYICNLHLYIYSHQVVIPCRHFDFGIRHVRFHQSALNF